MKIIIEQRLAWRQEFASALLDELIVGGSMVSDNIVIDMLCNDHIHLAEHVFDMRLVEFSLMGYRVKRLLKSKGVDGVIGYLRMLEDCFTDCKMCLN